MTLNELAVWATLGAFILPLISLAFSGKQWLSIRDTEFRTQRFQTYHVLIHSISTGMNGGVMKLTSQIAYIYELRNFPEYSEVTEITLELLRKEWGERETASMKRELLEAIDGTLAHLQKMA